jgi:prepilin-type N-terminal cleavage/methylation domain-containing protein
MKKKGLSLLEILISMFILSLVVVGLANIFISTKRNILHTRYAMVGAELTKQYLAPLHKDVRQDTWTTNCLGNNVGCPTGVLTVYDMAYTPTAPFVSAGPGNLRKAKITLTWTEFNE